MSVQYAVEKKNNTFSIFSNDADYFFQTTKGVLSYSA